VDAAVEAAEKGFTHYTPIDGMLELRQAISEKLRKDNGIEADPQTNLTVTSGSQEAMLIAALGLLNRGDEAMILDPYYPAVYEDTLLAEAKPVLVPLDADKHYAIDQEVLDAKVSKKTRMIWMCNPSNPTGHVFSANDLRVLADFAKRHDLIVFADEIYEKIVYDGLKPVSIGALPGMEERTVTVNGFSKSYAMTGWRIGYFAAGNKLSHVLRNLHYYAVLCPNSISQKAALEALTGPQDCIQTMVAEYARRRKLMMDALSQMESVAYEEPNGAFYVFPDFSQYDASDEAFASDLLKKAGVVTAPGSGFGTAGKGHLRISFSISYDQIENGMQRIKHYLTQYS
jgi:aspartate/methionine/tyrosine aminotransferase